MHAKGERCLSGWSSIEIMLVLSILTQQFLQRNTDGKKKGRSHAVATSTAIMNESYTMKIQNNDVCATLNRKYDGMETVS
jgi:hypothetical protein